MYAGSEIGPGRRVAVARALLICTAVTLSLLGPPCQAQIESGAAAPAPQPEFRWSLDAPLLATGATLLGVASQLHVTRQIVPPQGLDRSTIHWSLDRDVIGQRSERADRESDIFRDVALAYPMVLAYWWQPSGARLQGTLRRSFMYAEAILLAEGLTYFIKRSVDRPRPFTYLPADRRPSDPPFNVTSEVAFRSMPSGHATIAFCAAGFAMADHLISRPQAGWQERVGVSFIGGFLAGLTSGMRIEGGQHFPSDTMVGGLIGTASGVTVPILHHYIGHDGRRTPMPAGSAWWHAIAGEVVGIAAGLWVAEQY
jgi:membrane-associated phospholipid phosphatase